MLWSVLECLLKLHSKGNMYNLKCGPFGCWQNWQPTAAGLNVTFRPNITPESFQGFFSLTEGWGQFLQTVNDFTSSGTAVVSQSGGTIFLSVFSSAKLMPESP